ncbi:hypothetical protein I302_107313 [Kwoniella bestiolae CBS 10118]|uniref:Uncharacterized protein n=1 Tax=Kwoniella bestiolae CBS 10118 TaxID=1296100 RepID=A0A1B9FYX4_9TREE|nr:hypothetical protein I302_06951 [Kwoniella bestiolae CBS 10118]OCF23965.1 hypothetical protein I302_06951 [Kwoniella bestiolae CBS 10118]
MTIAILDFNPRILTPRPAVGTTLGGSVEVAEMTDFSQRSNPDGIMAMLNEKLHSCIATGGEGTIEAMCWFRTYSFFEKWIESMHYDDGAIVVEYSASFAM